jgi:hypothetical protein
MKSLKRSLAAVASGAVLLASVSLAAPANAAEVRPVTDSVQTVEKITAKAPGILKKDSAVKKQAAMIGTAKLPGSSTDLIATVSAKDVENSVVATSEKAQSMMTVLHEGQSSAEFALTVPAGYKAQLASDGGIELRASGSRVIIPLIEAPWALDANGKKLPTSYALNGSQITQHVNTAGATFPVVADPSLQWVPYPVIAVWGAEIKVFNTISVALASGGAWVGCNFSKVTGVAAKIVNQICTVVGIGGLAGVVQAVRDTWGSSKLNSTTCYGITVFNPKASLRVMPARDCY